jgi:hypothetical protein
MKKFILENINSEFDSYQQLINLYQCYNNEKFESIHLNFNQWFAANLSSALGGLLDKLSNNYNEVKIDNLPEKIKIIIQKNNFLSYYGFPKITDSFGTTIKYLKLKPTDGRYFNNYVFTELLNRPELPNLSYGLRKKIAESIYEIFVNAQIHSESEFIYTCGQFFPKNHTIEFTITDTGIGFKDKINKRFNSSLSSLQAIMWAIEDGNSTKENISGGIGLAILKEFVKMNKGKFQIISDNGFYQLDSKNEITKLFNGYFPGTIVNMKFKTDDESSYSLKSEIDYNDIF